MQAGVDGYLVKPFGPPQLSEQVGNLLGRRAEKRVARILADLDPLDRDGDHPLIIIADAVSGTEQLKRPSSIGVVLYSSSNDISHPHVAARADAPSGHTS